MADSASAQLAPGALFLPHALHYHLHRIKEAPHRRTTARPVILCRPYWRCDGEGCDPALWFVDEFAEAGPVEHCGKETCANLR